MEMVIVLAVLGIVASVATPALHSLPPTHQRLTDVLAESVAAAVSGCRDVVVVHRTETRTAHASAHCDGGISADTDFHLDSLPINAAHRR